MIVVYTDFQRSGSKAPGAHYLDIISGSEDSQRTPREINTATYTGEFTKFSRKNFRRAVDSLFEITPWRRLYNPITETWQHFHLSITTLTLSARPANFNNKSATAKLLNNFLVVMRNNKGLKNYIWKAELQDNLNIHYHLLSDLFCPHHEIRNIWNKIQSNHGIIKLFHEKHKHLNPNSTDIHTVHSYNELGEYLKKYTTKKATNDKFNNLSPDDQQQYKIGKVWDCSANLNKIPYPTELPDNYLTDWLTKEVKTGALEVKSEPYFTIYYPPRSQGAIAYPATLVKRIKSHYAQFRA